MSSDFTTAPVHGDAGSGRSLLGLGHGGVMSGFIALLRRGPADGADAKGAAGWPATTGARLHGQGRALGAAAGLGFIQTRSSGST